MGFLSGYLAGGKGKSSVQRHLDLMESIARADTQTKMREREAQKTMQRAIGLLPSFQAGDQGAHLQLASMGLASGIRTPAQQQESNERKAERARQIEEQRVDKEMQQKRFESSMGIRKEDLKLSQLREKRAAAGEATREKESARRFKVGQEQREADITRRGEERAEDIGIRKTERREAVDARLGIARKKEAAIEKAASGASETVLPNWNAILKTRDIDKHRYLVDVDARIAYDALKEQLTKRARDLAAIGHSGVSLKRELMAEAVDGLSRIPGVTAEDVFDLIPQARPKPQDTPEQAGRESARRKASEEDYARLLKLQAKVNSGEATTAQVTALEQAMKELGQ